jgi:hypothetical protein
MTHGETQQIDLKKYGSYAITKTFEHNVYTVWKDGEAEPYEVHLSEGSAKPFTCTCLHFVHRLSKTHTECKHGLLVRLAEGEG